MHLQRTKPTYSEISQASGISVATISRIMNSSKRVSEKARLKIIQALTSLGYDANTVLPRLSMGGDFILFNIPNIANPFYSLIIQGARDAAKRNGYTLLINEDEINEKTIENFLDMIQKRKPAGIITTNSISPVILKRLNALLPVIQCSEYNENLDIPFITIDNTSAAKNAVEHLLLLGCKRIAFLNGPLVYKYARNRLAGYNKALETAGIPIIPELIIQLGDINYDMALSAAYQLLNSEKRPDAFFSSSDVYAAAVIKAAKKVGLSVPDDLAVVGFDNIEISSICTPSITTVSQPRYQMGLLSCDMLMERISDRSISIKNIYLDTELIVRESSSRYYKSRM
ncbi:LacI family DNA-binding transcriptional regulator [Treponema sp. OMZ 840]|uniref:LacI family DNA-binding transcriptional regulator n=1 Tax=Treponema sp. OMZ 840 TaxID=244313 RepID=UPI003D922730